MERRELPDQTLFWNALDQERKLDSLRQNYDANRDHSSLGGETPAKANRNHERQRADISACRWESHGDGLYQLPVAA